MKKYIFPLIILSTIVIFSLAWWLFSINHGTANTMTSAKRQAQCEQFLATAQFANGEQADKFMQDCLQGEAVIPGPPLDFVASPDADMPPPISYPKELIGEGCMVGGCGGQVCGDAGTLDDTVTTCEYRNNDACFALTRCEKQPSGQCGWTETDSYTQCLKSFPNNTPTAQ